MLGDVSLGADELVFEDIDKGVLGLLCGAGLQLPLEPLGDVGILSLG